MRALFRRVQGFVFVFMVVFVFIFVFVVVSRDRGCDSANR